MTTGTDNMQNRQGIIVDDDPKTVPGQEDVHKFRCLRRVLAQSHSQKLHLSPVDVLGKHIKCDHIIDIVTHVGIKYHRHRRLFMGT